MEVERPFKNPDDPGWERRDTEWEQTKLTTIQTALILNIIHNLNGSDKIGWRYTLKAIELADEIQLFGSPPERYGREMSVKSELFMPPFSCLGTSREQLYS